MTTSLQPGTRISRYQVHSSLGAGGMGEVYLARDESLGRNIALKILPPELVTNDERVKRFIQEAKSASSLSHPHIVTIHEIGQSENPGGGPPIQFIAMELVEGNTLRALIHGEKTELRTLLRYLAQAADGLSKAHAAGIVHRDLKPDNIMVTKDGYAKVLDFGLAKLTERQALSPDDRTSAPTATERVTSEGAVMGTVGYMSPEQAQGKPADHRSDIFSFGCILYEAATRKKPFTGDSDVEVLHKILKEQPVSVEELNAAVPAEVRRLIRRCLAKSPDQRAQSMKDLAVELGEIEREYETFPVSSSPPGGETSGSRTASPLGKHGYRRPLTVGLVALCAVVLVAATYGALHLTRGRTTKAPEAAPAVVRITPLTNRGDVGDAALSPDGRYLAYTSGLEGHQDLRVHQITTGSDVEILPAGPGLTSPHLSFSADGDRLYFFRDDPQDSEYQTVQEVPSLGGIPRELARVGFDGAVSPDGKRVCSLRRVQGAEAVALVVFDLATATEKILMTEKTALFFFSSRPAWSADGKRIAIGHVASGNAASGAGQVEITADVTIIDADTGKVERLMPGTWRIQNLEWMPDSSGWILSAVDPGGLGVQIWYLSTAGGPARRITNDPNRYWRVTTSSDGRIIAAIRAVGVSNVWVVDPSPGNSPRQLTFAASSDNAPVNEAVAQDGVVYTTGRIADQSLWKVGIDGSMRRLVMPPQGIVDFELTLTLPNGDLLFNSTGERDGAIHVMRADARGDHAHAITAGRGEELLAASPDGRTVLYLPLDHMSEMWAVPLDGGSPRRIAEGLDFTAVFPQFSPDGRRIIAPVRPPAGAESGPTLGIFAAADGARGATLTLPAGWKDVEWSPDGKSLTFVRELSGVDNIIRQPLDGGEPVQLTRFKEGNIPDHEWSPNGDRILIARTFGRGCELATTSADGGRIASIARFETGQLSKIAWAQNGKAAVFMYGTAGRDAVLIRDFR